MMKRILAIILLISLASMDCTDTIPRCTECEDDTKCKSCSPGSYLSIDHYQCLSCDTPCSECINSMIDDKQICTNCKDSNMEIIFDTCRCKDGYYMLNNRIQCSLCQAPCSTCKNDKSDKFVCTKCIDELMNLTPQNQCLCPSGYFISLSNAKCIQCTAPCLTCSNNGKDKQNCDGCWDENMDPLNSCLCKEPYYIAVDNKDCFKCPAACPICRGNEHNDALCEGCIDSNMEFNIYGLCQCKKAYYLLNNEIECGKCQGLPCSQCVNNGDDYGLCTGCISKTMVLSFDNVCICPNQYFMADNATICIQCPVRCYHCIGVYVNEADVPVCIACRDTYDMIPPDCHCKDGFTLNEVGDDCIECPKTCLTCAERYSNIYCKTCKDKRMVTEYCKCPEFTTVSQDNSTCLSCSTDNSCKECSDITGELVCKVCYDGTMIIVNNTCKCRDRYYFNNGCKACDVRCSVCTGPSNKECMGCIGPHVVMKDGTCVCASSYTFVDGRCVFNSSTVWLYIVIGVVSILLISLILGVIVALCT